MRWNVARIKVLSHKEKMCNLVLYFNGLLICSPLISIENFALWMVGVVLMLNDSICIWGMNPNPNPNPRQTRSITKLCLILEGVIPDWILETL